MDLLTPPHQDTSLGSGRAPRWQLPCLWLGRLALLLASVVLSYPSLTFGEAPPPFELPGDSNLNTIRSALFETTQGDIVAELYPQEAPWHVANFKYLADKGALRDLEISHYIPRYIVQTAPPRYLAGISGNYAIPPEFNAMVHETGSLGMARKPNLANLDRSSSPFQFHFILGRAQHMDGQYTVFGRVTEGLENLRRLRKGDRITSVTVMIRRGPS